MCMCARVSACVLVCVCGGGLSARVPGRVHVRVRVALFSQHATRLHHIVTSFVAALASPHFSTFSHKKHDFIKRLLNMK
jgi:hypothetical protein